MIKINRAGDHPALLTAILIRALTVMQLNHPTPFENGLRVNALL